MSAPEASSAGQLQGDYEDNSVTIQFALAFNAVKNALVAVIVFNEAQSIGYVAYAFHLGMQHSGTVGYIIYLIFFNLSRASFLAVLLVVASGYMITRSDLGPHKQHVVFVPLTVLVTGLITDFSFYALQSAPDANTYDLTTMSTLAASMWFICSVLNLAALILAWLYLFEALGRETAALEEEHKQRTGKLAEEQAAAAQQELAAAAAAAGHRGYAALGGAGAVAVGVPVGAAVATPASNDPEAGGSSETVAEFMAYTSKKKVLSRFSAGVAVYLIADICVLLLPAFFNHVVQSTLQVLLFAAYVVFIVALLVLFRPQEASSYLMVGFSEEDAEAKGVNQLSTGIAMTELGGHGSDSDDEISRLRPAAPSAGVGPSPAGAAASGGPSSSSGGAPPRPAARAKADARAEARAAKAAAKAAARSDDRYSKLSGGALPVSTGTADGVAAPEFTVPPPPRPAGRGRYVPKSPSGGPFTLGDDDEDEPSDSVRAPLTRPPGKEC
ncbi:hypothetical protein HYH03_015163 [Edaphochlamys debaryana]|uniref:Uncharacterized protein n=1 Tax=Edaphochlamys debaryana TaxID=47281 RepID=A0A835XQ31_9CHLO|nr:hypothetical protein HYH03_015163 [Edaphochlamys debaryana]|eukprot:KAG2486201.1 hypothetical protein HYH03_015163 [Edaphochlamys debaryana]